MIYLDGDIQVYENIDHLFDLPNGYFYAVMDCFCEKTWSHTPQYMIGYCQQSPNTAHWAEEEMGSRPAIYFNAGMFVFEPSMPTYHDLLNTVQVTQPTPFAEQNFLNMYFKDIYKPIPANYNLVLAMLWRHPENIVLDHVKVVHYCAAGSKPWRYIGKEENMEREDIKMLVQKWWRFACEEGAAWRSIILSIYEDENVMLPTKAQFRISGPWETIKQLAVKEPTVSSAFFKNLSLKLGEGTRQHELVANMGWFEGHVWRWTLAWARELSTAERAQLDALQTLLQHAHPQRNVKDQILWEGKKTFSTKALIAEANKMKSINVTVDSLASTVWMKIAPPKIEFMTWLALLGKLNTREMLQKKGIIAAEANICTFCSTHPESGDHLLMSCAVSWRVWKAIADELDVKIETKQTFRLFYEWWIRRRAHNHIRKLFILLAFFATTWSLWHMRNMMIFQSQVYDHHLMCNTIRWRICIWSKAWKEVYVPYTTEELARNFKCIPRLFV